jgi:hypothetical protein
MHETCEVHAHTCGAGVSGYWACARGTFENARAVAVCEMCQALRPEPAPMPAAKAVAGAAEVPASPRPGVLVAHTRFSPVFTAGVCVSRN